MELSLVDVGRLHAIKNSIMVAIIENIQFRKVSKITFLSASSKLTHIIILKFEFIFYIALLFHIKNCSTLIKSKAIVIKNDNKER
jgi:hypothetical protein